MSRVAEGMDLRETPARGRPPKYDWDEWFDGRVHILVQGEDYDAKGPKEFRSTLYSAARRRGIEVVSRMIDGELHVQAILEDGEQNGHTPEDEGAIDGEEDQGRAASGGRQSRHRRYRRRPLLPDSESGE